MNQYENIKKYAKNCISGEIISCKKHKWACERFLKDAEQFENNPDYPFYWSEESAQNIVDWFALLRHSKGVLAGQPIILTDWQKFRICQLYGWRRKKNGYRRFKKSFTEVARKNAKSQEEAGIALYEISVTATKNNEVCEEYTAGVKRDQSKIVFNEAELMLRGSPLRQKFDIKRDEIKHAKTGSFIKALSKEDGKSGDGTNPAGLIIDEYHQHPTTEFYDLGLGSNTKEPLLMIITTAGVDLTYPCYVTEYTYCSKVLDPNVDVENEEYLIDICEMDEEDYRNLDNLENEELWKKANPIRMTYDEGIDKIRGEYKIAKEIPEHMTAFLTKCLNVWVQAQENGYMDMAKWKACQVDKLPVDTKGMSVYVGFDMSAKIDLTSVAFILPFKSEEKDAEGEKIIKYIVYSHSFIPNREKLTERKRKDKADYDAWERMNLLTVTDTPIVDQNAVMKYVKDTCKEHEWNIECLCFDPANAAKLMMDLSDEGYEVEEVYQSHKSLNESTQGFREQVYSGNIIYTYNPLLNFAMSNAVIRKNQGLIKIDKDATTQRIDPVDAILCAYKLALYHEFTQSFLKSIDEYLGSDW
ncbi:terminase large subunit [Ruminococcus sp. AF27-12AA]|jgi:phage terminase large subunit-like protein|nr:terminase large subunit [Ruminococcus sp. AF27-3]RGG08144.1 terminase large subunit [Ruminococcus sp. AF27-11AA]RGG10049.1 terminase large subunit [Ruminococcus sp. AF27-12AA]